MQASIYARIFFTSLIIYLIKWGGGSVHILLGTFAKHFNAGVVCMKFEV